MKTMHTTGFPSTRERDDATLIGVIAAVRAQAPLSQPARVDILLTQGLDALLEEVFGNTLIHPERDAALTQAALDLQAWREQGYQVTSSIVFDDGFGKGFLPGPIHSPASEALVGGFSGPIAFGEAQSGSSGA